MGWGGGMEVGGGVGDAEFKLGLALVQSGQVSGSDVESGYGYCTVLLLSLPYVHEFEYQDIVICIYTYYIRAMQKCRSRRGRGLLTTCAISAYHL